VLEKCRKVITVSYYEQERIKQSLNLDDQLVEVVYNGISHDFRLMEERDLTFYREKYHLPAEFILYFANPAPKKNAFNTLSAYKVYADNTENPLPLVLADTNQTYISRLLEKINAEHLSSYITVLEFIPFSELPYIYNLASLFLYPSKRESFGLPVVEAMACGTPVITSDTSSMPEVAKGAALLADPLDVMSIANQLIAYSSKKDSYEPLITKGLKRAKDFTWQHSAKKVLQIYNQLHEENERSASRNNRKTYA
jgi:glycosyltransferase involved in cell wall biosynthesis